MDTYKNPSQIRWNTESQIENISRFGDPVVDESIIDEIWKLRRQFGDELVVLGHHYQRDEVIQFADQIEDSLALSQFAAKIDNAKYVLFLGIHIMAETADMLTSDDVTVILPDLRAGCTMGDYAPLDDVERTWSELSEIVNIDTVVPVCYINATAAIKAFAGKHGGPVCTSSNTPKILEWALNKGEKVFFYPDINLGRNSAVSMGIPEDQMIIWDPTLPFGGNSKEAVEKARIYLWKGFCSVHEHFQSHHIDDLRKNVENINVIVHPEVKAEVFDKADSFGSTSGILQTVRSAPAGTSWAIGTEYHMVQRLAREMKKEGKEVYSLAPFACLCTPMFRITPEVILDSLKALQSGEYNHEVRVDPETSKFAGQSLELMFEITG